MSHPFYRVLLWESTGKTVYKRHITYTFIDLPVVIEFTFPVTRNMLTIKAATHTYPKRGGEMKILQKPAERGSFGGLSACSTRTQR